MEKTKTTDNDMYGNRCCYLVNLSAGWTDKRVKNHKKLILKMTVNKLNVCFTSLINDLMTFCNKFVCFSKIELIKKGTICIVKFSNNNI